MMMGRTKHRFAASIATAFVALTLAKAALADEPAKAPGEVFVILASEAEGPVDPSLDHVKALKEPPFNTFKSMKILSRSGFSLAAGTPFEVDLPNGRKLRITLRDQRKDGRFKVQVSINRPNQTDYLPLLEVVVSPGEPFFVAGQKYQGGTLVVGVRVGERRAHK
jgi:hypothetical protein